MLIVDKFQNEPDYGKIKDQIIEGLMILTEKDITDQVEIIDEPKLLAGGDVSAEFNVIEVE